MSAFKVGDRVRYTGAEECLSPYVIGKTGTITGEPRQSNGGNWDDESYWSGYFPGNLELIDPTLETRALDLIRRIATGLVASTVAADEARAIMKDADLDVDEAEAEKVLTELGLQCLSPSASFRKATVAAIRRGRALERGEG